MAFILGTETNDSITLTAADATSGDVIVDLLGGLDTLTLGGGINVVTVSNVEIIIGTSASERVTLRTAPAAGGSISLGTGTDTLAAGADLVTFDLTNTTLSGVEGLAGTRAEGTNFIIDIQDLLQGTDAAVLKTIEGQSSAGGVDRLTVSGTLLDLRSTTLSSIEVLAAGSSASTTFILNQADLLSGGSVLGNLGGDTIEAGDLNLNLSSTTLSGIETLRGKESQATTITVDAADLSVVAEIVGGTATGDRLTAAGNSMNLSATAVSGVEILSTASSAGTVFTVNQADLRPGGQVRGHTAGADTLVAADAALDLTQTTLSSIESLAAGTSNATTFTLDSTDVSRLSGGSITGGASATDQLRVTSNDINLGNVAVSGVEVLLAGSTSATTFRVNQADLASNGSVVGVNAQVDTLSALGTLLDLRSTTLSSIERLTAGSASATSFIVNQADLTGGAAVIGNAGIDSLIAADTLLDLHNVTLSSIERIEAGGGLGTTFRVGSSFLQRSRDIIGQDGVADTLDVQSSNVDLRFVSLSSVEVIRSSIGSATNFRVDQADLAPGGTIDGGAGTDTLIANGATLDLSSTTLTSVEVILANTSANTLTVNQADLLSGGTVDGGAANDTLVIAAADATLDLSSTTLVSIEAIAGNGLANTITVNQDDLLAGGSVSGGAGDDTLVLASGEVVFDLRSTALDSIETIRGNAEANTIIGTDGNDRIEGMDGADSLDGGLGNDILVAQDTDALIDGGDGEDGGTADTALFTGGVTAANLFDADMVNVEVVGIVGSAATVLDLSAQSEALTIVGGAGADTITGTAQADSLNGAGGNDTFLAVQSTDIIDGGQGSDSASFATTVATADLGDSDLVSVEAVAIAVTGGGSFDFSVQSEALAILGNTGADTITGGLGADTIDGGAGNDAIVGDTTGAGADTLVGGAGVDYLRGSNSGATAEATTRANDADVMFAGAAAVIDNQTGVFGESTDSAPTSSVSNAAFSALFAPWSTHHATLLGGANIVEGRGGNDALVASTQKDVFLYKTFQNATMAAANGGNGIAAAQFLGTDTIHNFRIGVDSIAVVLGTGASGTDTDVTFFGSDAAVAAYTSGNQAGLLASANG